MPPKQKKIKLLTHKDVKSDAQKFFEKLPKKDLIMEAVRYKNNADAEYQEKAQWQKDAEFYQETYQKLRSGLQLALNKISIKMPTDTADEIILATQLVVEQSFEYNDLKEMQKNYNLMLPMFKEQTDKINKFNNKNFFQKIWEIITKG